LRSLLSRVSGLVAGLSSLIHGLVARARSLLRGMGSRSTVEAEMREEFRHHIESRAEDLVRQGMPRREAERQAHREFGHAETHREHARAARGLRLFDQMRFSWIDVRLGLRILTKHPLLTLVAAFALAIGIPVGLAPMHLADAVEAPLPEDPDDRIRAIRLWDPVTASPAVPNARHYDLWSRELSSFSRLAAFRDATYQVASDDGSAAPVAGAQVTASTFELLGRTPATGRALTVADQASGAPDVVVIGHDLWTSRFAADPEIVGRTLRVEGVPHTVVGVMPAGFLFPAHEQLWIPFRDEVLTGAEAPQRLRVFGRLAPGTTVEEAQAELGSVGRPEAADPQVEGRVVPEVVPFGMLYIGLPRGGLDSVPGFLLFQVLALALLLVACGNVSMLIFARTATRFRELAVRTALGASRTRIVCQIFSETLVLAVLSAGLGVLVIDWILGNVDFTVLAADESSMPYWLSLGITGGALVRALALAVLSATVAGVVPALRITGRDVQQSIRRADAAASGVRFGGVTSTLIVADVALSVAVIALALGLADQMTDLRAADHLVGIPAEEYLAVELRLADGGMIGAGEAVAGRASRERLASTQQTLVERLLAEPGVRSVAVAEALPRMDHLSRIIEVEGAEGSEQQRGRHVRTARVDVEFFDALDQPVLSGRAFDYADLEGDARVAIVNTVFVQRMLGGREALGQRMRFIVPGAEREGPWHEIVGVVGHLGTNIVSPEGGPALYVPAAPGTIHPAQLAIHVGSAPERLAPRVREILAAVDPAVVLEPPVVLSRVHQGDWYLAMAVAGGLALLAGVLVTLVASGIFAMVSYSVSERTREIGIRSALGAPRQRVVLTILRRSLTQLGIGGLLGIALAAFVFTDLDGGTRQATLIQALGMSVGLAVGIVATIGVLSCLVPARRILAVQSSEALRAER
jgi:predicted permease